MAIDFTLSNEQRELQANAREFAENVLAPVVRAADEEPDPLQRLPAHEGRVRRRLQGRDRVLHAPERVRRRRPQQRRPDHRGGGDLRRRSRLRLHGARQRARPAARLVLRLGGAEGPVPAARDVRSHRRVHRRLRRERAGRIPGRHRQLRRAAAVARRHRRDRAPRRRRVRDQRPQVLALQRRRLGRQGREHQHRRGPHRRRRRAARKGSRRSWSTAGRRASASS